MSSLPFTHPWVLLPAVGMALLALLGGLWAQTRVAASLRVTGQRPWTLGLGAALLLAGLGLGLAEPRFGPPDLPRLTVHVVVDASRSMAVPDCGGRSRWLAAVRALDRLWKEPLSGVRYSLNLLTGDLVPLLPAGDDRLLLKDSLSISAPGDAGSPGSSLGRCLAALVAPLEPKSPEVILLLSDGEETWEARDVALGRALGAVRKAQVPVFAVALGDSAPQPVTGAEGSEPQMSRADRAFLETLATATGGKVLGPETDLAALFGDLAKGRLPLPQKRSTTPAHPEWGAWLALLGLGCWLLGTGRPLRAWRPVLLALGTLSLQAQLPVPPSVEAWVAQTALDRGDVDLAKRWRPRGPKPLHRLIAAQVDLRTEAPKVALETLAPLLGQGVPRPVPVWRAPALLLAARAQVALGRPDEAMTLLERLLAEVPGHPEASHNLQSLVKDTNPPPPNPKKPPPPPPPRPSQGARQDELEGLKQRTPKNTKPPGGIRDL